MNNLLAPIVCILFILAINALSEPKRAYRGNFLAIFAMAIALIWNFYHLLPEHILPAAISLILGAAAGIIAAQKINMPALPQMVALLNGFGGLAAGLIGIAETAEVNHPIELLVFIIFIGFMTFSGSLAAFIKLSDSRISVDKPTIRKICLIIFIILLFSSFYASSGINEYLWGFALLTCLWGFFFILPIGGADMPIIISVLNSLSGWSTVLVGFSLNSTLLIIVGTLIGSSGAILAHIMTKAMNRSLLKVIFPLTETSEDSSTAGEKFFRQGTPRDAAFLMQNANKVIIVPGYGMAAANAQNELKNMATILKNKYAVDVKFAIHPVAGRMPGHINVLLAEADVDPDSIFELKDINQEFQTADVAYVIGANDTTNPLAKTKTDSPIYQMPILEVEQARKILFVKRSLAAGYAGIDNPLFYEDKTIMLLGDAREVTKQIVTDLEE